MSKSQIVSIIVTLGASLDTLYGFLADNAGLLSEFGLSPKITKIVMLLGLLWTAFNKPVQKFSDEIVGDRPGSSGGR